MTPGAQTGPRSTRTGGYCLDLHRSEASTRSLVKKHDPRVPLSSASMCWSGSTAGLLMASRPRN
jgi:hypothetical protein